MSELRDDGLARERAIDPTLSVLLQAPAGSGKTTVLTQRLLRLLAIVEEPEQILAITFTRKAAAEMRARVLKALRGEVGSGGAQTERLRQLAQAALVRSRERGWNLLEHPGRLRIQTIDSFNYWLASQLPVASRAGGTLSVADRPDESYARAARNTLIAGDADERLAADIELLFDRLDNNWGRVERLLSDMLRRRGHWLRYVLGRDDRELVARIEESMGNIVSDHLELAVKRISPELRSVAECVPEVSALDARPESLATWQRLAAVALTKVGEWRKPKGVTKALGPAFEAPAAKDALRNCIEYWSAVPGALDSLRDIAMLPTPQLTEADSTAIAALARVLRSAAVQLQAEFAVLGEVDHTYVAGAAREALTESGQPTDLALRAGLALRHILVDEFQDTSIGQFDLLEALTVGWEPGDGRTLFVVGDPMQSIYQFREAEVGLFLRARDNGIGRVRLEPLQLVRNFRSVPELIEWSNETFAAIFPPHDDLRASAVSFTPSIAARDPSGEFAVELRLFETGDADSEASSVAQRIHELRTQDPSASAAVLVASRMHAVPVMAALQSEGIPVIGVELVPLRDLPIVRDLVALLHALHHLGDRTSWLTVLRAPWCGVTLATLTELSRRDESTLIWEALAEEERLRHCEAGDVGRIRRIREVLADGLSSRDQAPLAQWLESVWMRLGGPDAYAAEDLAHARAFLDVLSERTAQGDWRGPRDIGGLLAELFAEPRSSDLNPVQVMTIHRAKGLEFDHVFLPGLARDLNRGAEPLLRWLDLPRSHGESDLVMAPVTTVGEEGGRLGGYLKKLMAARAANERARLLYVAVTRARRTLHLSAAPQINSDGAAMPRAGTLLACLRPVLAPDLEAFKGGDHGIAVGAAVQGKAVAVNADIPVAMAAPPAHQSLRRLRADWSPPSVAAALPFSRLPIVHHALGGLEFSWAGETLRHIGTVVHAALERFATLETLPGIEEMATARPLYRQQLHRLGVPREELDEASTAVIEALSRTLGDERGRWIFAGTHREAHSELTLTGIASGRLVSVSIDRSFVDEAGIRWVIDFKTSRHKGGDLEAFLSSELERYRPQLEGYVSLASALGPQPVRAALYFPLLGVFRELQF